MNSPREMVSQTGASRRNVADITSFRRRMVYDCRIVFCSAESSKGAPAVRPSVQSSLMSVAETFIGVSDHFSRAELVTLAVEDAAPVFRDRRRVELIDTGLGFVVSAAH